MTSQKKNPVAGTSGAQGSNESTKNLQSSGKSTAIEAQRARIVAALRRCPQSTEDLRKLGIFQAPARVKELRDRFGYVITTARITLVDRDGYSHPRAALYTLVAEPNGQQPQ